MRHSPWWLLGQFAFAAASGAVMIAVVVAAWYALSFLILSVFGRVFPMRGRKR